MAETVKIYTVDDMRTFRDRVNTGERDLNAILMNNINIAETDEKGHRVSWLPIGLTPSFKGIFDGKGHVISGLHINKKSQEEVLNSKKMEDYVFGLFGVNDGTIKNLTVRGSVKHSRMDHLHYFCVGGLCAENREPGVIENCTNRCKVCGDDCTAGVAGCNAGVIRDCVNTGRIIGDDNMCAGIFGNMYYLDDIKKVTGCVNTGYIEPKNSLPYFDWAKKNNYSYNQIGPVEKVDSSNRQDGKVIFPFQNSLVGMYILNFTSPYFANSNNSAPATLDQLIELIMKDKDPTHRNSKGQTYLHLICSEGNYHDPRYVDDREVGLINFLAAETDIDFAAKDIYGKTAANYAKQPKVKELIQALYQEKRNKEIEDSDESFSTIGF